MNWNDFSGPWEACAAAAYEKHQGALIAAGISRPLPWRELSPFLRAIWREVVQEAVAQAPRPGA